MFDTITDQLATYERQGTPPAIIAVFRSLYAAEAAIDAGGFTSGSALQQKLAKRDEAVQTVVAIVRGLEAEGERQGEQDLQAHDRAEHERVTTANGHGAIDLDRVRVATSPAELLVMMNEARSYSTDGAVRAWKFIEPKLREMAAKEQRRSIVGTGATAFGILCKLQGEMRDLSRGLPNRAALVDGHQRRARGLRRQAVAVAQAFGLERQVEMGLRKAAVPEGDAPTTGQLVSGRWFDQFGSTRK